MSRQYGLEEKCEFDPDQSIVATRNISRVGRIGTRSIDHRQASDLLVTDRIALIAIWLIGKAIVIGTPAVFPKRRGLRKGTL